MVRLGTCIGLAFAMGLASAASAQCSNDCGAGLVDEGEICLTDGDFDLTNGGCDGPAPLFTDIVCGDTVCGLGSTYNEGTARDRDWYRISQAELDIASGGTGVVTVTASVPSEFDHSIRIMALGDPVCVDDFSLAVITAAGAPDVCNGTPTVVSATVVTADHPNGIAIIVYPNNFSTVAECDFNDGYILEVTCVGNDASCDGSASHNCAVPNPGVPGCSYPPCCAVVCAADPSCCVDDAAQGWQPACADLARDLCDVQCINDCGPALVSEDEPCLLDGGSDIINGGCNLAEPLFANLFCADSVCGVASTYDAGMGRDLDWYRISQEELIAGSGGTGVLTLTARVAAEFDHNIWIMALGDPICDTPVTLAFDSGTGVPVTCSPFLTETSITILASDHPNGLAVVVGPKNFSTLATCADNDAYSLEVFCDGHDADCDGSASHDCLQTSNGNPGCNDPDCCVLVCEIDPTCCTDLQGQGWTQICVDLATQFCRFRPKACAGVSPVNCQMPELEGSGGQGDNFVISLPSDEESNTVAADNFRVDQSGDITEVCWWGYYDNGSDCFNDADDVFQITYYHDDGNGMPVLPEIASYTVNASAVWEGFTHTLPITAYTVKLYRFSATHPPVSVGENQCYWIEIRKKNLDDPCVWYWEVADHNLDHDYDYCLFSEYPHGGTYELTDGVDIELGWCVNVILGDVSDCAPPPPDEDCVPPGTVVLTQNNEPGTLDLDASIACSEFGAFGWTYANWYARSYDLSDPVYGVAGQDVWINCVRFAVETNDGFAYPVTVNVYEDTNGGSPTNPSSDLSLLGSELVWVPVGASGFLKARFNLPIPVAADSVLVVELEAPDRDPLSLPPGVADTGGFWPGCNPGATTDSFIRAPTCGAVDYVPISTLDFEAQLLQSVHVLLELLPCPCDCEATPDGTVDVGDFLALLAQWGTPGPCDCEEPPDGAVDVGDFLGLLAAWGNCY